jgi:hypothetical protein
MTSQASGPVAWLLVAEPASANPRFFIKQFSLTVPACKHGSLRESPFHSFSLVTYIENCKFVGTKIVGAWFVNWQQSWTDLAPD